MYQTETLPKRWVGSTRRYCAVQCRSWKGRQSWRPSRALCAAAANPRHLWNSNLNWNLQQPWRGGLGVGCGGSRTDQPPSQLSTGRTGRPPLSPPRPRPLVLFGRPLRATQSRPPASLPCLLSPCSPLLLFRFLLCEWNAQLTAPHAPRRIAENRGMAPPAAIEPH